MSTGLTPNYSLSYPISTDPVNVASDIEDLAKDLDTFLTNPTFLNNININGGSIVTSGITANLFNANAVTLNIGAAATTISIGNASGQVNFAGNINIATGKVYEVNNVSVLSSTTLGSSVVNSNLTSVGAIATGTWNATVIAVNKGGTGVTTSTGTGSVVLSASPAFTLIPTAPTAAVNTNTTQLATTGFVVGQASSTNPTQLGSIAIGTSLRYSREDHVHPTTGIALLSGATFVGTVSVVSPTLEESKGVREITMSTVDPTGGLDGDIWIVYSL